MSSYPFVQTSSVFNTNDYNVLTTGLTIETANMLYLSLAGGVISGNLNVLGTLSINGSAIDLSLISGVVAGTPQASKVLSLNSSSQLNGNLQLATSRKILMNNSASSLAYIDMGATASDRCISLFSDATSYYGFGANLSNLRSFSKDSFAWYTGATQSVIGTSIMTLNSAGLLTITSLTATTITGTLQTAAQPNITSVATLDITTHDGSSVGLKLGGVLVSATAAELNYNTDVVAGTVLASSSVVVDSNKDITGFRRLSVGGTTGIMQINALTGGDAAIRLGSSEAVNKCWTIQYLTATNLLRFDAFGSNSSMTLTPAGDLTSKASFDTLAYKLNGVAITMSALTSITLGTAAASKALTLDASSNITGIVGLSATNLTGTLQTAAQPNITSIGTLASLTATNITGTLQTAAQPNITSIGTLASLTATNITGTLQTAAQPNITSLGSLTTLTTSSLTLGATAITATGIELNYLDLTTGAGTAEASKALVLDSSKNIATINNLGMSGILTMTATSTTLSMTVPSSITRSNFVWNGDTGVQWEYGMRGSANTLANALYWYSGGYRMVLFNGGQLTVGGQQTPTTHTLQVNHATGSCIQMTYNLTSNLCNLTLSSGGILTIAPSANITAISGTTGSTSNTTGALTLSGGIGISLTTDATSSTNGGTFTTAGGAAIAKKLYTGDAITSAGKIITTISGQGWNHNDGVNNLVSYVNNAGFGANCYFGSSTASNLVLQTNNIGYITIDGAGTGLTSFTSSTDATSSSAGGCVQIAGGVGITKKLYVGSTITGANLISSNSYSTSGVSTKVASLYGHQAYGSINTNGLYVSAGISFLNSSSDQMPQASIVLDRKAIDQGDLCIFTQAPTFNLSETCRFLSTGALSINTGASPIAMISCIGSGSYLYGTQYQRLLHLESNNATPIKFEVSLNKNTAATSTNECLVGTTTANDLYIGTDSTYRFCIKATTNYVGIGDNGSTVDKVFGILNGTVGSGIVDMRFGNALSANNCFTMTYAPTSSGSGLNRLQFDPYGSSGALTILAKKYVGVGTTGPICPLDVAGSDSGLGILAPYQVAGNDAASGFYVTSGTTTGVSINARFQSNVIFDDKIYIRSDRRVKKDIVPLTVDLGIKFVNEVDPVLFRKKNQSSDAIMEIGYIAQDIMKAGFGNIITHTDNDNMKIEEEGDIENIQFNVDYSRVCAILHSVVKDQQKRINSLEDTLEDILNEIREVKSNQCLDILYS